MAKKPIVVYPPYCINRTLAVQHRGGGYPGMGFTVHFIGPINLCFYIHEKNRSDTNVAILLKHFMDFAKQMDTKFCIKPLKQKT
jgi:hypothetical protein